MKKKIVLSIAGSDSGAGAGIQADIKSAAACGSYMATAITAITSQNTVGVNSFIALDPSVVKSQIDAVAADMNVEVIKTGMLPTKEIVEVVCDAIRRYNIKKVVVDPVLIATSGDSLAKESAGEYMLKNLFPLATIITPNISEAEQLSSVNISSVADFEKAAAKLNAEMVLIKGGHLTEDSLTDILFDFKTGKRYIFKHGKIETRNTHGTGCSLSSSIAAFLCQDYTTSDSVSMAIDYLQEAIQHGANDNMGEGHGSVNHLYKLTQL